MVMFGMYDEGIENEEEGKQGRDRQKVESVIVGQSILCMLRGLFFSCYREMFCFGKIFYGLEEVEFDIFFLYRLKWFGF